MRAMPAALASTAAPTPAACAIAVAACAFAAGAPEDAGAARVLLQLLPAQDFAPSDGRAMDVAAWRINAGIAKQLIAAFNAQQPPVIDYEHQTLHKEQNGHPAPAAGWIHGLRWIDGRGLFAVAELTERARSLIAAGEYRYFSPVFEYARQSGDITRIVMGALTNHPAIAGMQALSLQAAASARLGAGSPPVSDPLEIDPMNELLKKLLAALGLPEGTSEDDALAAAKTLAAQAGAARTELELPEGADAPAVAAACARLRSLAPDPAQYVPVAAVSALQAQVAALSAQARTRTVDDLVAPALKDGRLLPAMEAWARELGAKDMAALSAFLATAQPLAALTGTQTGGKSPAAGAGAGAGANPHGLSDAQLSVAAACGMTPEDYARGL